MFYPKLKELNHQHTKEVCSERPWRYHYYNIRNNIGPSIEHCRTPHMTVIGFDIVSLILSDC